MSVCYCGRNFTQTSFTDNPKLDSLCDKCLVTTDVLDTTLYVDEYEHPSPLTLEEIVNKQYQLEEGSYRYG